MGDKVEFFELADGVNKMTEALIDGAKFSIKETEYDGGKTFSLYVFSKRTMKESLVAYCQSEELLNLYLDEKLDLINSTIKSLSNMKPEEPSKELLELWRRKSPHL